MLDFPPYAPTSFFFAIAILLAGIAAGAQAFANWRALIKQWRTEAELPPEKQAKPTLQQILLLFVSPFFILVGTVVLLSQPIAMGSFRRLQLGDISGATIYIAKSEEDVRLSQSRRMTDAEPLRAGLQLLSQCKSEVSLNHEHFTNGYVIMLESDKWQTGDYKIGVFRSTSRNESKTSVVPYVSAGRTGYLCPTFQQWVAENIDPMFLSPTAH